MPRKPSTTPAARLARRKLGRLTKTEELALSLGYTWQAGPARKGRDSTGFTRGVWKHPKTGHLHTAQVIALMQKPLDPAGQPFALSASLSELMRQEREERKSDYDRERLAAEKERNEERRKRREAMLLA